VYEKPLVQERHRHRYEFNNKFRERFVEKGMIVSGVYAEKDLVEIVEVKDHPWFVGVQFHPEFKSKPDRPHPLFRSFIETAARTPGALEG
jgi:CTP synthase